MDIKKYSVIVLFFCAIFFSFQVLAGSCLFHIKNAGPYNIKTEGHSFIAVGETKQIGFSAPESGRAIMNKVIWGGTTDPVDPQPRYNNMVVLTGECGWASNEYTELYDAKCSVENNFPANVPNFVSCEMAPCDDPHPWCKKFTIKTKRQ